MPDTIQSRMETIRAIYVAIFPLDHNEEPHQDGCGPEVGLVFSLPDYHDEEWEPGRGGKVLKGEGLWKAYVGGSISLQYTGYSWAEFGVRGVSPEIALDLLLAIIRSQASERVKQLVEPIEKALESAEKARTAVGLAHGHLTDTKAEKGVR